MPEGKYLRVEDAPLPSDFEKPYEPLPKAANLALILNNIASTQPFRKTVEDIKEKIAAFIERSRIKQLEIGQTAKEKEEDAK